MDLTDVLKDQSTRLREEADRLDRLADAARLEGDGWDEAELRARAVQHRRQARRYEVK